MVTPNFYFIFKVHMCLISHRESFEKYLMVASISVEQLQEVFLLMKTTSECLLIVEEIYILHICLSDSDWMSPGIARMSLIAIL